MNNNQSFQQKSQEVFAQLSSHFNNNINSSNSTPPFTLQPHQQQNQQQKLNNNNNNNNNNNSSSSSIHMKKQSPPQFKPKIPTTRTTLMNHQRNSSNPSSSSIEQISQKYNKQLEESMKKLQRDFPLIGEKEKDASNDLDEKQHEKGENPVLDQKVEKQTEKIEKQRENREKQPKKKNVIICVKRRRSEDPVEEFFLETSSGSGSKKRQKHEKNKFSKLYRQKSRKNDDEDELSHRFRSQLVTFDENDQTIENDDNEKFDHEKFTKPATTTSTSTSTSATTTSNNNLKRFCFVQSLTSNDDDDDDTWNFTQNVGEKQKNREEKVRTPLKVAETIQNLGRLARERRVERFRRNISQIRLLKVDYMRNVNRDTKLIQVDLAIDDDEDNEDMKRRRQQEQEDYREMMQYSSLLKESMPSEDYEKLVKSSSSGGAAAASSTATTLNDEEKSFVYDYYYMNDDEDEDEDEEADENGETVKRKRSRGDSVKPSTIVKVERYNQDMIWYDTEYASYDDELRDMERGNNDFIYDYDSEDSNDEANPNNDYPDEGEYFDEMAHALEYDDNDDQFDAMDENDRNNYWQHHEEQFWVHNGGRHKQSSEFDIDPRMYDSGDVDDIDDEGDGGDAMEFRVDKDYSVRQYEYLKAKYENDLYGFNTNSNEPEDYHNYVPRPTAASAASATCCYGGGDDEDDYGGYGQDNDDDYDYGGEFLSEDDDDNDEGMYYDGE